MKRHSFLISIFISFLVLCLCTACSKSKKKESLLGGFKQEVVPVDVYVVKKVKSIPISLEYPGITKSFQRAVVCAKITGTLEKVLFKEGDFVKEGTPLFSIEKDIYLAKYESAKAAFLQAKAQLERAEKTWERVLKSYKAKLVSDETKDNALAQYKLAKANLQLAKARLKEAEIYLNYTLVKAPISGIAEEKKVDPGNLVSPGKPLVEIDQIDPIYVTFSIPDEDVVKYHFLDKKGKNFLKKLKVKIKLSDGSFYPYSGKIDFVSSTLERGIPALKVRAIFPNQESSLLPNLFVRVVLLGIKKRNVLLVPKRSVMYAPEGEKVYVVEGNKAVAKLIKIGEEYKDFYVVEEGLKPGDKVIVDNLLKLTSGTKIKVEKIVGK
jgi:membrane fusion protein (multidrug efflux system)